MQAAQIDFIDITELTIDIDIVNLHPNHFNRNGKIYMLLITLL